MSNTRKKSAKIRHLRKELERQEGAWEEKRQALVKPTLAQTDEFWDSRRDVVGRLNEQIEQLQSSQLIEEAGRYDIPIPEFVEEGGPWSETQYSSSYYLNSSARAELRSAIRKEKTERSEIARTWLTIVLSVIGAVTGVAALLVRR